MSADKQSTSVGLDLGRFANLPAGFLDRFTSERIDVQRHRLHVVRGGGGPPVLLIAGWPQSWYAWRLVMPPLADAGYTVVAVDPRGMGDSDAPETDEAGTGYDTGTVAAELVELMSLLGYARFDVVGHDVGMWIGYALGADHPRSVRRLALIDAIIPGLSDGPLLLGSAARNARQWHFGFNRAPWAIQEPLLAAGGGQAYVAWQFRTKAASADAISPGAVEVYRAAHAGDGLRSSLNHYRAIDATMEQNARRRMTPLQMPVLAVGGAKGVGEGVGIALRAVAPDLQTSVLPNVGHYVPEEDAPRLAALLVGFLSGESDRTSAA